MIKQDVHRNKKISVKAKASIDPSESNMSHASKTLGLTAAFSNPDSYNYVPRINTASLSQRSGEKNVHVRRSLRAFGLNSNTSNAPLSTSKSAARPGT